MNNPEERDGFTTPVSIRSELERAVALACPNVIQELARTQNSALNKVIDDQAASTAQDYQRALEKHTVIRANMNLRDEERQIISENYPHIRFLFDATTINGHGLAALSRIAETETLIKSLKCKGRTIIDVGGNWSQHVSRNRCNIHSCCPLLDARDADRHSNAILDVESCFNNDLFYVNETQFNGRLASRAVVASKTNLAIFCHNKAQHCTVQGYNMMCVQSVYDIKMEELADAMTAHNTIRCVGTFIFHPAMLVANSGTIPDLGAYFEVTKHGKIEFTFMDDPSTGYTHDYKHFKRYLQTRVFQRNGSTFYYQLRENRIGVQYFRMTRNVPMPGRITHSLNKHWLKTMTRPFRVVYVFNYLNHDAGVVLPHENLCVSKVLVDAHTVDHALQYAMRIALNQLTPHNVFGFMSSHNNKVIINGHAITSDDPIDPELLLQLSTAIAFKAMSLRFQSDNVFQCLRDNEKTYRELQRASFLDCLKHLFKMSFRSLFGFSVCYADFVKGLMSFSAIERLHALVFASKCVERLEDVYTEVLEDREHWFSATYRSTVTTDDTTGDSGDLAWKACLERSSSDVEVRVTPVNSPRSRAARRRRTPETTTQQSWFGRIMNYFTRRSSSIGDLVNVLRLPDAAQPHPVVEGAASFNDIDCASCDTDSTDGTAATTEVLPDFGQAVARSLHRSESTSTVLTASGASAHEEQMVIDSNRQVRRTLDHGSSSADLPSTDDDTTPETDRVVEVDEASDMPRQVHYDEVLTNLPAVMPPLQGVDSDDSSYSANPFRPLRTPQRNAPARPNRNPSRRRRPIIEISHRQGLMHMENVGYESYSDSEAAVSSQMGSGFDSRNSSVPEFDPWEDEISYEDDEFAIYDEGSDPDSTWSGSFQSARSEVEIAAPMLPIPCSCVHASDEPSNLETLGSVNLLLPYEGMKFVDIPEELRVGTHVGQFKLMMADMHALVMFRTAVRKPTGVIVVGSAPGDHWVHLCTLLYDFQFLMIDPRKHAHGLTKLGNVTLRNIMATPDKVKPIVESWARKHELKMNECLLVMDFRTEYDKNTPTDKVDEIIEDDNDLAMCIYDDLKARHTWFKFRLPWNDSRTAFFHGQYFYPVCGAPTTTEGRYLVAAGAGVVPLGHKKYEQRMAAFNLRWRRAYYENDGKRLCWDCYNSQLVLTRFYKEFWSYIKKLPVANSLMLHWLASQIDRMREPIVCDLEKFQTVKLPPKPPKTRTIVPTQFKPESPPDTHRGATRSTTPQPSGGARNRDLNREGSSIPSMPNVVRSIENAGQWYTPGSSSSMCAPEQPVAPRLTGPTCEPPGRLTPNQLADLLLLRTRPQSPDLQLPPLSAELSRFRSRFFSEPSVRRSLLTPPLSVSDINTMFPGASRPTILRAGVPNYEYRENVSVMSNRSFRVLDAIPVQLYPLTIFSAQIPEVSLVNFRELHVQFSPEQTRAARLTEYLTYCARSWSDLRGSLLAVLRRLPPLHRQYREWDIYCKRLLRGEDAVVWRRVGTENMYWPSVGSPYGNYDLVIGNDPQDTRSYSLIRRDDGHYTLTGWGTCIVSAIPPEFVLGTSSTRLVQSARKFVEFSKHDNLRNYDIHRKFNCDVHLIEGVPGSGKTRHVIESVIPGDLVVCSTKVTADEIRRQVPAVVTVRTVDAYVLNDGGTYPTVYFDEALMTHPGEIDAIALMTGARQLYALGDRRQIGFINRSGSVDVKFDKYEGFKTVEKLNLTYRCPQDVVAHIANDYNDEIRTTSRVEHSIKTLHVATALQVPEIKGAQYITFTQDDKYVLQSRNFEKVNSIHEVQGRTFPKVVCARLGQSQKTIYGSRSHQIVGLTRHTQEFMYVTVAIEDPWLRELARIKLRDDLVVDNGGFSYVVPRRIGQRPFIEVTYPEYMPALPDTTTIPQFLQASYCAIFPRFKLPLVPRSEEQFLVENGPIRQNLTDCRLDISRRFSRTPSIFDGDGLLRSRIVTMQPSNRVGTQTEILQALQKRNMNAPCDAEAIDTRNVVPSVMDNFLDTMCLPDARRKIAEFRRNGVHFNRVLAESWINGTKSEKLRRVEGQGTRLDEEMLSEFNLNLKSMPKSPLVGNSDEVYTVGQTICHHSPTVTAVYSSMFREIQRRLLSIMSPKIYMHTKKSRADIERFLNNAVRDTNNLRYLEFDFSQFDKSQNATCLDLECALYELLGLDDMMLTLWKHGHEFSTVRNPRAGIKFFVNYQRKTGDATTLLGNTIINMLALSSVVDYRNTEAALFMGDDSLAIYRNGKLTCPTDLEHTVNSRFNLTVKNLRNPQPYFCSMFLVPLLGRWYAVGDPVKRLECLGRPIQVTNYDDLVERYVSYKDLMTNMNRIDIYKPLAQLARKRYFVRRDFDFSLMFATLYKVGVSFENYIQLYYEYEFDIEAIKEKIRSLEAALRAATESLPLTDV